MAGSTELLKATFGSWGAQWSVPKGATVSFLSDALVLRFRSSLTPSPTSPYAASKATNGGDDALEELVLPISIFNAQEMWVDPGAARIGTPCVNVCAELRCLPVKIDDRKHVVEALPSCGHGTTEEQCRLLDLLTLDFDRAGKGKDGGEGAGAGVGISAYCPLFGEGVTLFTLQVPLASAGQLIQTLQVHRGLDWAPNGQSVPSWLPNIPSVVYSAPRRCCRFDQSSVRRFIVFIYSLYPSILLFWGLWSMWTNIEAVCIRESKRGGGRE